MDKGSSKYVLVGLLFINVFAQEQAVTDKSENVLLSTTVLQKTTQLLTQKTAMPTAAEVDDLLHGGTFKNLSHPIKVEPQNTSLSEDDENLKDSGKWDTELIEDGSNTEDERIKHFAESFRNSQHSDQNYELVTVFVICVIALVITGYAAYYSWRKLDRRCKKRQVLVNEIDPDDMRHFSI